MKDRSYEHLEFNCLPQNFFKILEIFFLSHLLKQALSEPGSELESLREIQNNFILFFLSFYFKERETLKGVFKTWNEEMICK